MTEASNFYAFTVFYSIWNIITVKEEGVVVLFVRFEFT